VACIVGGGLASLPAGATAGLLLAPLPGCWRHCRALAAAPPWHWSEHFHSYSGEFRDLVIVRPKNF